MLVDMGVVVGLLVFVTVVEWGQKRYVTKFKDQTIEMDDFTIRIQNLPKNKLYGGNPEFLKAYLTNHFETLIKDQILK